MGGSSRWKMPNYGISHERMEEETPLGKKKELALLKKHRREAKKDMKLLQQKLKDLEKRIIELESILES